MSQQNQDRAGSWLDQATPQLRHGSGQIAADRVLDLKRFGLPLRLFATAPSGLACCPPRTAVPTEEHNPTPGLDDLAERPQVPGRLGHVQRLVQVLLEPRPGRRQARRHRPAGPARAAPDRSPARYRSRHGSSRPAQPFAQACDSACSGEPTYPSSPPLGKTIIRRLILTEGRWPLRRG